MNLSLAIKFRSQLLKVDEKFNVSHRGDFVDDIVKYEFVLIDGELKENVVHTVRVLEHQGYLNFH